MIKSILDNLKNKKLSNPELLALISAASVLRKDKLFKELLFICKKNKIKRSKVYETILQTYLFAGFPSAIVSLKIVNDFFPKNKSIEKNKSNKGTINEGTKTCKKIYGEKFGKLISNIKSFSPELADWLVIEGYGKVLSRKGLSLSERELSIISILTVQKFESQLYSHLNGAFRQKVREEKIKKIIENLDLLNNNSYTKFGLKVFNKFVTDKNNAQSSK